MNYKPQIFALFAVTLLNFSCNSDATSGNLSVKAAAQYANVSTGRNAANVQLSKFIVNIREIELEYDDDLEDLDSTDVQFGTEQLYQDVEFDGPFILDLLGGNTQINIASAIVPLDVFEEIEFDMHKNEDSTNELLFGKSILIEGTIDGVPFVFWHDTNEEYEVDYANAANDITVTDGGTGIIINFDLNIIFGTTSSIDFSTAVDGNQDGVIEIHPGDDDGNSEMAHAIKNLLHEASDLLDD